MIAAFSLGNLTKITISLINSVIQVLENRFSDYVSSVIISFHAYIPLSFRNHSFSHSKANARNFSGHFSNVCP